MKLATMVDKALMSVVLPGTAHSPYAPIVFLVPTEVHTVYILNPQGSPSDKLYSLRNISTRDGKLRLKHMRRELFYQESVKFAGGDH
jgi:hypothetical protein